MRTPHSTPPQGSGRPRAAMALLAALLAMGLGGCTAAGARATAATSAGSDAVYVPPEAPAGWPDATAPQGAPADLPPALTAAPPPTRTLAPPPTPAPAARPVPQARPPQAQTQAGPQATGSSDPGSRYLPLGEPVGGLPTVTPPLGYR